ncbi:leucine-rich repeat, cysteine-containing subtype protein [Tanacetum coccineum]
MPYIQDNHDLYSVSLVSKKFFDIDSKTRKHVTVYMHYLRDPKRLSRRFPNLESLKLKSCEFRRPVITPWIQEISIKFTLLNSLYIRSMTISPSDLKRLAKTRGANLRSLDIRGCNMFSEDGLIDIARYCIDLRILSLQDNLIEDDYMPNGKWLHELALCNTVMESLSVHPPFDTYDMKDLTRLAKKCSNLLVSLNIYPRSLSDFKEVFKHAKKLDHFGDVIIDEDWDYSGFKFPPNIRGLGIRDLRQASFPFLLPYLNQLRELDLYFGDLEHDCLCFLFERCPNLEVLYTSDPCGDEALQVIGQFCEKLRKLCHHGRVMLGFNILGNQFSYEYAAKWI